MKRREKKLKGGRENFEKEGKFEIKEEKSYFLSLV